MRRFFGLLIFETIVLSAPLAKAEINKQDKSINVDQEIIPSPNQISKNTQKVLLAQTSVASVDGYITFDDYPINTAITNQFEAQGVIFNQSFIELDNLSNPIYLSGDNEFYPDPYGNGQNAVPITANFLAPTDFV